MKKIIVSVLYVTQLFASAQDDVKKRCLTLMGENQIQTIKGICTIDKEQDIQPAVHLFTTKRLKKRKYLPGKKSYSVPALAVVWLRIQDRKSLQDCPNTIQQEVQDHLTAQLKKAFQSDLLRNGRGDEIVMTMLSMYAIKDQIPIKKRLRARLKELHIILLFGDTFFEGYKRYDGTLVSGKCTRKKKINLFKGNELMQGVPRKYMNCLPIVMINLKKWLEHLKKDDQ